MTAPLGTITNSVGTLTTGHVVTASEWNTAVGGIYTYINSTLLNGALNKFINKGDILVHDGTNLQALAVGTNTQVLTADSTQATGVKWAAPSAVPLNTNGDTLYYNSGALQRLPIGTTGQLLTVAAGLPAWSSNAPSGVVPIGGIIMWSGSLSALPTGFSLCDGSTVNGVVSPNLQGLFVVGAGNNGPAATGGMGLLAVGGPNGDLSAGAGLGPAHTHTLPGQSAGGSGGIVCQNLPTSSATITPRYYALAYIIRNT